MDVKTRGGTLEFKEQYPGQDGVPRETKHNLFARQLFGPPLESDVFLFCHLQYPKDGKMPGTVRQKNWRLFVCGWASKERVAQTGVYVPRGALTERGKSWFPYRGQEVEFYQRNLNGLQRLGDLLVLDRADVEADAGKVMDPNLTTVDAARIAFDLIGRGLLPKALMDHLVAEYDFPDPVTPVLHSNQYLHLAEWLRKEGLIEEDALHRIQRAFPRLDFTGI